MALAIFGIGNTALNLAVTLLVLVLVAVWLATIVFTFSDARRRITDPFLVGCATVAALFPFVGTLVYTILRPPEYLEDVREREVETRESEVRLRHLEYSSCHKCGSPVESDFLRCPACRTRLKHPCPECSRPVGLDWKVCPYCEHTLIAPRRSSRRESRGGQRPAGGGRPAKDGSGTRKASGKSGSASGKPRRRPAGGRAERPAPDESDSSSGASGSRSGERLRVDPDEVSGPDDTVSTEADWKPINGGKAD